MRLYPSLNAIHSLCLECSSSSYISSCLISFRFLFKYDLTRGFPWLLYVNQLPPIFPSWVPLFPRSTKQVSDTFTPLCLTTEGNSLKANCCTRRCVSSICFILILDSRCSLHIVWINERMLYAWMNYTFYWLAKIIKHLILSQCVCVCMWQGEVSCPRGVLNSEPCIG